VLVGEDKEKFLVHEDIVCKTSEFFKAASEETGTKEIHLPDHHPTAFKTYLESIYNPGSAVCTIAEEHAHKLLAPEEAALNLTAPQKYAFALVKLSVLADYLVDVHIKNAVIESAWDTYIKNELKLPEVAMKMAFEPFGVENEMHKLCADIWADEKLTTRDLDRLKRKDVAKLCRSVAEGNTERSREGGLLGSGGLC
jgi:hypothetical protein